MKKCDFCVACEPDGKCAHGHSLLSLRAPFCEDAIKRMVKVLKGSATINEKNK